MSDENPAQNESIERLIEDLRLAQRDRRNARNWMTLMLALIVVIFIYLGVFSVQNFGDEDMDLLAAALADEASRVLPGIQTQLKESANRLVPAYEEAFVDVFTRDREKFEQVVAEEYLKLQQHGKKVGPRIEEAIAQLVIEQEETARQKLSEYISPEQLDRINTAYQEQLTSELERYFETRHGANLVLAENMMEKLAELADSETDLPPADSQYVIGMFLELLGLEMQENVEASLN